MTNLHNVAVFGTRVKTGYDKGSAKLVGSVFNFDLPGSGSTRRFPLSTFSPGRVPCSLSAGVLLGSERARITGCNPQRIHRQDISTQRTGGGSLKERGGVYGVGKLPTVEELLARLNHTVRFTRIYEPHTMRGASLAVGPNRCRSLSKNTRTNGRTAIRKGVPASQQRVSRLEFLAFSPAGSRKLCGKRFMGEQIRDVIRRVSNGSSAILLIIGYGALQERDSFDCAEANPSPKEGYESVAGIQEQGLSTCLVLTLSHRL